MTNSVFQFGQRLPEYAVPVLNERAVRASAGLLFFFAIVCFMNAWLMGNFQPTRIFVVTFLVDFTIRIFINPLYSPSLIIGQWFVRKQQPEYVGAPQKRFAWAIGFVLALTMLYLVVLNNVIGPINLIVCSLCLTLLFFETAFGICIGCKVYNFFNKEKAQLCPGGVCEVPPGQGSGATLAQLVIVALFAVVIGVVAQWVYSTGLRNPAQMPQAATPSAPIDPAEAERCKVPDFAKALGHEEKWKLHNNCK
ncbi:MAG TPA: DUF4395 domain-containing protein [Polaromonas sp.]|uniref:DUF4395 domain-containing protein n=1 Tax=Polaromonas sp. UBA4122 TaxID=1947074 RepID=UPI000EEFDFF2|nr:DUF4395 domain-containing protein [Polaromonas sp. UBA4122]HAL39882.1 DUF4395 domain-containing protein [Polaromonas sp.]